MKNKFIYPAFFFMLICTSVSAQKIPRNLKVGDTVPSIVISNVLNDSKNNFNTSDFKDKLLILDFWNTMCKACIEALPKVKSLQQQFGSNIKIFPITYEPLSTIKSFLGRNNLIKDLNIPMVVDDKILSKWFRFYASPHEVWIYKNKVIAITSGEYVDAENIQKALQGNTLNLPVKDDFYDYDYNKSFLNIGNTTKKNIQTNLNYVAITGYQEGATSKFSTHRDDSTKLYRTYFTNFSILQAYNRLWQPFKKNDYISSPSMMEAGGISKNQIIIEAKDKSIYIYNAADDYQESWHRKNDISYEWVSKDTIASTLERNKLIINDLDRFLKINGRWEKRKVNTLSLVHIDPKLTVKSAGGANVFDYSSKIKRIHNIEISNLVYYLNNFADNPPTFDETGYSGNIDMVLEFESWTDIPSIRRELNKYGFDLRNEIRLLDIFVLTEK